MPFVFTNLSRLQQIMLIIQCYEYGSVLHFTVRYIMSGGGPSSAPASWSLKKLRSISKPSLQPTPNPTLVEVNEWVWPSHCHQHEAVLRHGQLLRWMDVAACLSGRLRASYMHGASSTLCNTALHLVPGLPPHVLFSAWERVLYALSS